MCSKTASKSKLCATTNGKHPQGWSTAESPATNHAASYTVCSCSCSRRGPHADNARQLVNSRVTITADSPCTGTFKFTASKPDGTIDTTVISIPVNFTGPIIRRIVFSQFNTSFCGKPNAVFRVCFAPARRLLLLWPRITCDVRSRSQLYRWACSNVVATTSSGDTERSLGLVSRVLLIFY